MTIIVCFATFRCVIGFCRSRVWCCVVDFPTRPSRSCVWHGTLKVPLSVSLLRLSVCVCVFNSWRCRFRLGYFMIIPADRNSTLSASLLPGFLKTWNLILSQQSGHFRLVSLHIRFLLSVVLNMYVLIRMSEYIHT